MWFERIETAKIVNCKMNFANGNMSLKTAKNDFFICSVAAFYYFNLKNEKAKTKYFKLTWHWMTFHGNKTTEIILKNCYTNFKTVYFYLLWEKNVNQ